MTQRIGIGVVGYGAIARVHTAALAIFAQLYPDMDVYPHVVAITPGGTASSVRALRDHPSIPHMTLLDLLAHDDINVVLCTTPTAMHFDHVQAALRAGKHVMCEKPLTVSVAQSRELVALADAQQRILALNHHFRHVPALREIHQRVSSGALGTPISGHLRYYRASNVSPQRPATWRFVGSGGGVLVDLGSHLIDLVHFLFQTTVVRLQANLRTVVPQRPDVSGQLLDIESDDVAWLTAQLANGMRVTLEASKMVPGSADDVRIEVYGTQSSLMFDMLDVNSLAVGIAQSPASVQRIQMWNRMEPAATLPSPETSTGSLSWHAASWQQCLSRVVGLDSPLCDGRAGLAVDVIIAAAQQSAAHDGVWVEVINE